MEMLMPGGAWVEAAEVCFEGLGIVDERALAAKTQRVEHLGEMACRRLGKRELAHGWDVWVEVYVSARLCKRRLASGAARLTKPRLVEAYACWRFYSETHAFLLIRNSESVRVEPVRSDMYPFAVRYLFFFSSPTPHTHVLV